MLALLHFAGDLSPSGLWESKVEARTLEKYGRRYAQGHRAGERKSERTGRPRLSPPSPIDLHLQSQAFSESILPRSCD